LTGVVATPKRGATLVVPDGANALARAETPAASVRRTSKRFIGMIIILRILKEGYWRLLKESY
jgi:hypothetical protein